jgi:Mechanosensitive ion channel, conserved TM helix
MASPLENMLHGVGEKFVAYLPNLFVGLILIATGWLLGWVTRRFIMRMCVLLRVDRWLVGLRWGRAFALGDVRYALYSLLGNIGFAIVFLALLDAAVTAMKLNAIATLLERGVTLVPRMVGAAVICGLGWLAAGLAREAVARTLKRAAIQRAELIAQFARAVLFLFFAAMALAVLDVAREIVVIGFTVMILTLGTLAVVLVLRSSGLPRSQTPDKE